MKFVSVVLVVQLHFFPHKFQVNYLQIHLNSQNLNIYLVESFGSFTFHFDKMWTEKEVWQFDESLERPNFKYCRRSNTFQIPFTLISSRMTFWLIVSSSKCSALCFNTLHFDAIHKLWKYLHFIFIETAAISKQLNDI